MNRLEYVISFPDPLYGHIRVTELEKIIIDLPEFQRLKRIKQLGVASIIFPGAQHTRFEHCLGTMYIADKIFDRFKEKFNDYDHQKVRLAGLLHDIGHAPFSHTFEIALKRLNFEKVKFKHEVNTRFIVSNIGKKEDFKETFTKMIKTNPIAYFDNIGNIATGNKEALLNKKDKLLSSIISGEIDADRIDYLIRDGLHTGVNFIGFNLSLLLENLSMIEKRDGLIIGRPGEYRAFHERIAVALGEAFLISRYHHYTYLVNHPRNISANLMMIKAFENAFNNFKNKKKNNFKRKLNFFYTKYDDNDLLNFIAEFGGKNAKKIIGNYKKGIIYKYIFDLKSNSLNPMTRYCLEIISQRPHLINNVEKKINLLIGPNKIFLYNSSVKGIPKELRIRILGEDRFLYDESELASGLISEILSSNSLYIFCEKEKEQICVSSINKNWFEIEKIFINSINEERKKNPFRLDFLFIFLNTFYHFIRNKYRKDDKIENEKIRYITRIYNMIKWIQDNYPKELLKIPLNYKFNNQYGFNYSPELFEDIMKLSSIRFIKTVIEEKEKPLSYFGVKTGVIVRDYFDERALQYYRFYILKDGLALKDIIINLYPQYLEFLRDHMEDLYKTIYIPQLTP